MLTQEMLQDVPSLPGVYFFHGASGKILYIGKAKCLRKRVRSYLHKTKRRPSKIKRLVRWTTDVQYQVCQSELEALFLESRLIKEHQPSYNTALKYGRKSWYIRVALTEDFPDVEQVSEIKPDTARYFGPFFSRRWTAEAIDIFHRIFPIRTCKGTINPHPEFHPCFRFHIKRCEAPCATYVTKEAYQATIADVVGLLEGNYAEVFTSLITKRDGAGAALQFERAAAFQKQIERIQNVFTFLDVYRK